MNAYEQRLQQFTLIQSIRESLPAGYSARTWDEQICITHDTRPGDTDSRARQFVKDAAEWEALKPTLR